MGYLEEFIIQINNRDFSKFLQLWEEYCTSDHVEAEEFITLLKAIKKSDFAKHFGKLVDTALPLWQTIKDPEGSYATLRELIDLQSTNTPQLAEIAFAAIEKKYGSQRQFNERLRLIGMRNRDNFQGALASYDLLDHMRKGKFVFHTAGWETGEIMDVSDVREQVSIEFENVAGRKHMTFANTFKTLIPLPDDHFLARRFADPDKLEKEAKKDSVAVIKLLLRDLGPKTAAEIKDELCDLVIPEKDWTKWWQGARAKLKKDTMVETPSQLKDPFILRKSEMTHEQRLIASLEDCIGTENIIQTSYSFVRDFPHILKNIELKQSLQMKLLGLLDEPSITKPQELQLHLFLEHHFEDNSKEQKLKNLIHAIEDLVNVVEAIEIIALKKRALTLIRNHRKDWIAVFVQLLNIIPQSALREYIVRELNESAQEQLMQMLRHMLQHPGNNPEFFVWYFQLIVGKDGKDLPFSDKKGQLCFFESFLILFNILESKPEYRDLSKKMYVMISGKRFALVRALLDGSSIEFISEYLLLVSKCQSLTDHDVKILRSLAEVVHPSLAARKKHSQIDTNTIWTTEEGLLKTQEYVKHIGTTEIVANAREIEAARALGDLRENSEYKFALEKRSRLQGELKTLSEQLQRARIITQHDVHNDEISVGSVIDVVDANGEKATYTLLGPWDANPEKNILSFQSKLAQSMIGLKVGNKFTFKGEEYRVVSISNIFEK